MKKPILAAAFVLALTAAQAADFPHLPPLKEGLWKIRLINSSPGEKTSDTTENLCRNHAYDQQTDTMARKQFAACSSLTDTQSGNKHLISMTCKVGNSTVTTHDTVTIDGDTHYHSEILSTFNPPLYGESQSTMIQDQTYLGACPANMHPGDRQLANGTVQPHR